jgi:hypothetical protein
MKIDTPSGMPSVGRLARTETMTALTQAAPDATALVGLVACVSKVGDALMSAAPTLIAISPETARSAGKDDAVLAAGRTALQMRTVALPAAVRVLQGNASYQAVG